MKVLILTILLVVISSFAICNGKLTVIKGISYDGNGHILFAGNENEVTSFYSVPTNGVGGLLKKFEVVNPQNSKLDLFYQYLPLHDRYYVRFIQEGSPIFSIYNQHTNQMEYVNNIFNTPFVPVFDEGRNRFVFGGYGIFGLNKLPITKSDAQSAHEIYESQMVNGLAMDGTDLYMTTYQGELLKGITTCVNCTKDQLRNLERDSDASKVSAPLIVLDGFIYIGFNGGIKGYPKRRDLPYIRHLATGENINAMTTDGHLIYYSNNLGVIKSVSTAGQIKVIFTPNA